MSQSVAQGLGVCDIVSQTSSQTVLKRLIQTVIVAT